MMIVDLKLKRTVYIVSIVSGPIFSLFIVYFMAYLVSLPPDLDKGQTTDSAIDFIRHLNKQQTFHRKRILPKKPPKAKVPPEIPKLQAKDSVKLSGKAMRSMKVPSIDAMALGIGALASGVGEGAGDREVIPIVESDPIYPIRARLKRIEGFVLVQFDVDEKGEVENVVILDSRPRKVFDAVTTRAVYRWKYRPKIVNGKPVYSRGLKRQIDFKITE